MQIIDENENEKENKQKEDSNEQDSVETDDMQEENKEENKVEEKDNNNVYDLFEEIKMKQKTDTEAMKIINEITENDFVNREEKVEAYIIQDDVLYKRVNRNKEWKLLLFVPMSMRTDVIRLCHDDVYACHHGITRTEQRVTERFYWPGYSKQIVVYINTCKYCAERKSARHMKPLLKSMPICTRPMQLLGIDGVGPYNITKKGNIYMLTAIDYYTKYAWAFPVPDMSTETIMKVIMKEIVCVHGAPESILTDRGSSFKSELANAIYALINTKKIQTTSYHPQTNGLVERMHRMMNDMLSCVCKENDNDWDENIQYIMMSYRKNKQATTGYSPFYLMHGREMKMPIDISIEKEMNDSDEYNDVERYVNVIMERMKKANEIVVSIQQGIVDERKNDIDDKKEKKKFRVGELVMVYIQQHKRGMKKKLEGRYEGPYEVVDEIGDVVRRIKKIGSAKKKIINVKKLKLYEKRKASTHIEQQEIDNETKCDQELEQIQNKKEKEKQNKQTEKGKQRLNEMNKRKEAEWKAQVPLQIAWNDNNNSIYTQDELVDRLKQFYKNDYRDAKRDLEQIDINIAKAYVKEKAEKDKVYMMIAQQLINKLQ